MSSLFPAGAYHWLEVRTMLVATDTVPAESVPLRGSAGSAKPCLLTLELVLAVVVISTVKSALPP